MFALNVRVIFLIFFFSSAQSSPRPGLSPGHKHFFQPVRATPNQKMEAASSVQQKDKMAGGTPRKLRMSHSVGNGTWNVANFCRVGTGHFRSSGKQIWKSIWGEHKIIAWSYSAHIYAESVSNYSICVCGSKVNAGRNILFVYRPFKEKHIHVDS